MNKNAAAAAAPRRAAPRSAHRWGSTLRSLLVDPGAAFRNILQADSQRAGAGTSARAAPALLAGLGGAGGFLLWLKLAALVGIRSVGTGDFRWAYLAVAAVLGAVAGVIAQWWWSATSAMWLHTAARSLRTVWAAAAVPQLLALVVLLPLDLALVGEGAFTSTRLQSPLATGWAALSIALWISLTVWSLLLIVRGAQVAANSGVAPAIAASATSVLCLAAVLASFYGLSLLAPVEA